MKKIILSLALVFSSAFAADLDLFKESSKAWLGAVSGATGLRFKGPIIIPTQGLLLTAESCQTYPDSWFTDFTTIKNLTALLGNSVKGIAENEWLSISVDFSCYSSKGLQLLARVKGPDLSKNLWEIWVNGKKQ